MPDSNAQDAHTSPQHCEIAACDQEINSPKRKGSGEEVTEMGCLCEERNRGSRRRAGGGEGKVQHESVYSHPDGPLPQQVSSIGKGTLSSGGQEIVLPRSWLSLLQAWFLPPVLEQTRGEAPGFWSEQALWLHDLLAGLPWATSTALTINGDSTGFFLLYLTAQEHTAS